MLVVRRIGCLEEREICIPVIVEELRKIIYEALSISNMHTYVLTLLDELLGKLILLMA